MSTETLYIYQIYWDYYEGKQRGEYIALDYSDAQIGVIKARIKVRFKNCLYFGSHEELRSQVKAGAIKAFEKGRKSFTF